MDSRIYEILNVPIEIKSNIPTIFDLLDKFYCSFPKNTSAKQPLMELVANVADNDIPSVHNLKIFAITPDTFDGWDYTSEVWCGKSIINRYVFPADNYPPRLKPGPDQKIFEIKTRVNPAGIRAGWLAQLHFHINLFVLQALKNTYIIHGGALEWQGKGLLLAGVSGAGKSTLTYALAKAGLSFLTDENILFDISDGSISPYPVSPSFDKSNAQLFAEITESFAEDVELDNQCEKTFINIKNLGIKTLTKPVSPKILIFPKYQADKKPAIKFLSKAKAAEELSIFTFQKEISVSPVEAAERLTNACDCYELIANQLDETVQLAKTLF